MIVLISTSIHTAGLISVRKIDSMLARSTFRGGVAWLGRSRAYHSSPQLYELSARQIEIVKSTAPVLAEHGVAITTHFYKRMLNAHPELQNIFNTAHQATGAQPAALAHAVWAYAENIDNLAALTTTVSRIGHKHASVNVTPEQYPIVGEHLLASIQEILGDAIDRPVLTAWREAYAQLAKIFIDFEAGLYQQAASTPGGWDRMAQVPRQPQSPPRAMRSSPFTSPRAIRAVVVFFFPPSNPASSSACARLHPRARPLPAPTVQSLRRPQRRRPLPHLRQEGIRHPTRQSRRPHLQHPA